VNDVDTLNEQQREDIQAALKQSVGNLLPTHMVPAAWVLVSNFPLTPNGKVDRKALPLPSFASSEEIVSARSDQEARLVLLWQDVLGLPEIGVTQNFFELGGHSLLATKVSAVVSIPSLIITNDSKIDLDTFIASRAKSTKYINPIIFCLGGNFPAAII